MRIHDANCQKQLEAWFSAPRTRLLLQREHVLLRDVLPRLTGFRLLQIGEWGLGPALYEHSGILYHWRLARHPQRSDDIGFDGVNLPIASGSMDALLLAHTLDLSAEPHRLLRECERVLNDRGQLVVMGFNPMSLWAGARHLPWRQHGRFPVRSRFYSTRRVCDWLRLLDFEPQRVVRFGVGFPFFKHTMSVDNVDGWHYLTTLAWLAQAYMIVARKRVVPMTRVRWRRRKARRAQAATIRLANGGVRRVNSRR